MNILFTYYNRYFIELKREIVEWLSGKRTLFRITDSSFNVPTHTFDRNKVFKM